MVAALAYRSNVLRILESVLGPRAPVERALDFGSGDGWFATRFRNGLAREVVAVDVIKRPSSLVEPILYDGRRLPFEDRSFDLSYCVDCLHHCPDPLANLEDLLRCTRRWFLIKDHTYSTLGGFLMLSIMDELGNRRFGIPSRYRYQRDWNWFPSIERAGFALEQLVYPAACHSSLPWRPTNRLQFVALFSRGAAEGSVPSPSPTDPRP